MFVGIFSVILVPATFTGNLETYATHPNHTDCTNWASKPDKDCDGLADQWEIDKKYVKSGITVNLPSAVNWQHRDVLVEIDYMSPHEPSSTIINRVVGKFNAMTNLQNPDGTTGVKLHYTIGDSVPHKTCINIWNDTDTDSSNDFDNIKKTWMGTTSSPSNYYEVARDVYHYVLFIHTRCGTVDQQKSAGIAEGPGNDAVISLGYPGWGNVKNGHDTGSDDYKARAFAHELGHNFGLKHAGSADLPHCKPNYISVMNYLFEFPTKIPSAAADFDYSKNLIPELNENALVEANGIGPSWPNGLPTGVGHSTFSHAVPPAHVWETTANNVPINYNWYKGDTDPPYETVSSSITNFHFSPCNDDDVINSGSGNRLWGFNDIHYQSLNFWALTGANMNSTSSGISSNDTVTLSDNVVNETSASSDNVVNRTFVSGLKNLLSIWNASIANETGPIVSDSMATNLGINESEAILAIIPTLSNESISAISPPCDSDDPYCDLNRNDMFRQSNAGEDWGNRTTPDELTVSDVSQALSSNVLDIDSTLQNLGANNFTEATNASMLKDDLQYSLVNGSESVYNLINSSKTDQALLKLSNLRTLIDGSEPSNQILKTRDQGLINMIDGLTALLEKKR